jgi:hypothetical protein
MRRRKREGKVQPVGVLLKQAMPPLFEAREKLDKAARAWGSVVGPVLARQSVPLDIAKGELLVAAEGPLVGNRLVMMGGHIARALAERWGLEVVKVKVVVGNLPLKSSPEKDARPARPAVVTVREEDVREFSSRCVENTPDFPEDAAESLARLRAFYMKRFKK